jgi:peptide deformylase
MEHSFTAEEQRLIGKNHDAGRMRVLKTDDPDDAAQLRLISAPFTTRDLQAEAYSILKDRMLATVKDPANPGVGIAAPQIGILKQLIAVERHDREEPAFEFYANPRIERYSEETASGGEGCLSVPNRSEEVVRAASITLSYLDEKTGERRQETVEGFTAVIFQHEIDHLNGILYIDRIANTAAQNENSPAEE